MGSESGSPPTAEWAAPEKIPIPMTRRPRVDARPGRSLGSECWDLIRRGVPFRVWGVVLGVETGDKLKTDDQEKNNGATIRRMTRNHESGENKVRNITEEKTKNKTERENQNEMRWE